MTWTHMLSQGVEVDDMDTHMLSQGQVPHLCCGLARHHGRELVRTELGPLSSCRLKPYPLGIGF